MDKKLRKKKQFRGKSDTAERLLSEPLRNETVIRAVNSGMMNLPDGPFRTNFQAELLCTGKSFRVTFCNYNRIMHDVVV